jgi:xanthine dehydrogenase small subunit
MAGDESARFVAGNTDLGVMTNLQDQRFPHLISLEGIGELREFLDGSEYVEIGAGLTLTEIEDRWTSAPGIFKEWIRLFGSPLIRNRATLGGNLATASPIGDAAPMLLALNAEVLISGSAGERLVPLQEFFTGYRQTLLGRSEVLRSVRIPKPLPTRARFYKVAKRGLDDISTVAAGMALAGDEERFGFGGVAPVPIRFVVKRGREIELRDYLKPIGDHRGSAGYRFAVAQSLIEKFRVEE